MNYDPYTVRNHQNSQGFTQYSSYEDFYRFFEVGPQGIIRETDLQVFPLSLSQKESKKKEKGTSDPTRRRDNQYSLNPTKISLAYLGAGRGMTNSKGRIG